MEELKIDRLLSSGTILHFSKSSSEFYNLQDYSLKEEYFDTSVLNSSF